jgi:hypothetical protein
MIFSVSWQPFTANSREQRYRARLMMPFAGEPLLLSIAVAA